MSSGVRGWRIPLLLAGSSTVLTLALLGIVGELENRYSRPLPPDAERCKTPREFLDLVNDTLKAGA